MKSLLLLLALVASASLVGAELPPLFATTPRVLAPARPVAEFPAGTFLENVLAQPDGTLLVNSHLDGRIYRIDAASGRSTVFAQVPGTVAGLAAADDGDVIVSGWRDGKIPTVFRVTAKGTVETLVTLPDGQFPNGVARLKGPRYLVADSYRGVIWEIDAQAKSVRTWFEHPTLARPDPANGTPAVNGLKLHDGALYYSNTQASTLHRLALDADGAPSGEPRLIAQKVNLDDFDIGTDGALYGTTHIFNVALRISLPDGAVSVIAEADAGMVGCTAAVFGATAEDRATLYVVGNGGLSLPPPGGLQAAKVTALAIGQKR